MFHMKYQALFAMKNKQKIKMSSAAVVISIFLRVKLPRINYYSAVFCENVLDLKLLAVLVAILLTLYKLFKA